MRLEKIIENFLKDTIESIFLAFKTIVQKTQESPEPRLNIFIDFIDDDLGFGMYWNNNASFTDTINVVVWKSSVDSIIDKTVEVSCTCYFFALFECAKYLQKPVHII